MSSVAAPVPLTDLIAVEQALSALEGISARASQVVELRFFGGFTVEETAEALRVSVRTVINDWNAARLWLLQHCRTTSMTPDAHIDRDMTGERWDALAAWVTSWLAADESGRARLRAPLAETAPDLVAQADAMLPESGQPGGFLETPAILLAAGDVAVKTRNWRRAR